MTWSRDLQETGNWLCGYLGEECSKQKEESVGGLAGGLCLVRSRNTKGPMWLEQGKGGQAERDTERLGLRSLRGS